MLCANYDNYKKRREGNVFSWRLSVLKMYFVSMSSGMDLLRWVLRLKNP